MHTDFAPCLARPTLSVSFVIALSAVLSLALGRSVRAQPPEPKYDADELADRQRRSPRS